LLEVVEQRSLQVALNVFRTLGQAGEFENVGIAKEIGDVG